MPSPSTPLRPAVFVDRDDTILNTSVGTRGEATPGDLSDPSKAALIPGSAAGLARLKTAGFVIVVYTSQGAVARGNATLRDCEAVNDAMRRLLADATGDPRLVSAVYFCPFHPGGTVIPFNREHPWRKPAPGMVKAASEELGLDLGGSWAIGDKPRDIEAAVSAGVARERTVLVGTSGEPAAQAADLASAAGLILLRAG
ncbi:MAG: HAD-IIIA family hydrolase [Thermoleophilia bacterium]|nr:HAD-IIIA family hydrolase [Thermoleophilia bacterium]